MPSSSPDQCPEKFSAASAAENPRKADGLELMDRTQDITLNAAFRQASGPTLSTRSTSALHSLMEQGNDHLTLQTACPHCTVP